ncbi:S8 family serine peptidase [Alteribacillus bidgolensis]|uniref:S8 family serine peptidase n=1 Tax=Alteribacillus bidgolensis TaxID=930129 RepID=UPI00349EB707
MSDDVPAPYTSSKPTVNGFIKPDVAVPGTNIVSLILPNSTLANELPNNRVGNNYFTLTGTSMATGIASGVIAIILQAYPTYSGYSKSSSDRSEPLFCRGLPRILIDNETNNNDQALPFLIADKPGSHCCSG